MAKQKNSSATTPETVLDDVLGVLRTGVEHIRTEIEKIANGKAEKNGHDNASRIAFLTAKVGAIADSVRKVEAAKQKRNENLSVAHVVAWARELEANDRKHLVAELQRIDRKRSGLA